MNKPILSTLLDEKSLIGLPLRWPLSRIILSRLGRIERLRKNPDRNKLLFLLGLSISNLDQVNFGISLEIRAVRALLVTVLALFTVHIL
jgi:hypothetical protein